MFIYIMKKFSVQRKYLKVSAENIYVDFISKTRYSVSILHSTT